MSLERRIGHNVTLSVDDDDDASFTLLGNIVTPPTGPGATGTDAEGAAATVGLDGHNANTSTPPRIIRNNTAKTTQRRKRSS